MRLADDVPVSVGVYRRTVQASLKRVWENVLDWEHLPWLHASSFAGIELIDSGPWGWRARVQLPPRETGPEILLELRIDRQNLRYVAQTEERPGKGTEIWTQLDPKSQHETAIEVQFRVPGVAPGQADSVGAAYVRLYTRLWDEDEQMMRRRETMLLRRKAEPSKASIELGSLETVRAELPLLVELDGQPYRVVELEGELVAHSTICPHLLGPLDHSRVEGGCLRCPWHGHRFDVRTGRSTDGSGLKLLPAPQIRIDSRSIVHLANGSS